MVKSSIHLRPYMPADWEALQEIHDPARMQELRLANLEAAFLPLSIAAEREGLFDYTLTVAELDGQAVGFAACTDEELAWLYVHPSRQRQGVGTALVRHVLETVPTVQEIEVLWGNTPARALYESCGFRVDHEVRGVMPGNEAFPVRVWVLRRDG